MVLIDNATLSFIRFKDSYNLKNKTLVTAPYTVYKKECNSSTIVVSAGILNPNEIINIKLTGDGYYYVTLDTTSVYFNHWVGLRNTLIPLIKESLCGDGECSLSNSNQNCLKTQELYNYLQTFINLVKPYSLNLPLEKNEVLFTFIQRLIYSNNCFIKSELCKQISLVSISGNSIGNKNLFNFYVSVYYLSLYFYDKYTGLTLEEKDYYTKVYDFNSIKLCIKNIGLCINDIEDLFEEIIINGQIIPPSIGNKNFLLLSTVADNYADFIKTFNSYDLLFDFISYNSSTVAFIIFKSLPNKGNLTVNLGAGDTPVLLNTPYTISNLNTLKYRYVGLDPNLDSTLFTFIVEDSLENNTNLGNVLLNFAASNDNFPPTNVPNINVEGLIGSSISVPMSAFLIDYSDPENDSPLYIVFNVIPNGYTLSINGNNIEKGIPINYTTNALNNLVIMGEASGIINYSIADVGSSNFGDTGNISVTYSSEIALLTVNAGVDVDLEEATVSHVLNAVVSSSFPITSVLWSFIGDNNGASISTSNSTTTSILGLTDGNNYTLKIEVENTLGQTAEDTINITVSPTTPIISVEDITLENRTTDFISPFLIIPTSSILLTRRSNNLLVDNNIKHLDILFSTYTNNLYKPVGVKFTALPVDSKVFWFNNTGGEGEVNLIDTYIPNLIKTESFVLGEAVFSTFTSVLGLAYRLISFDPELGVVSYISDTPHTGTFKYKIIDEMNFESEEITVTINTVDTNVSESVVQYVQSDADLPTIIDVSANINYRGIINSSVDTSNQSNLLIRNQSTSSEASTIGGVKFTKIPSNVQVYVNAGLGDVPVVVGDFYGLTNTFKVGANTITENQFAFIQYTLRDSIEQESDYQVLVLKLKKL